MRAIFKKFNGKNIIFDNNKGPNMDGDTIYLRLPNQMGKPEGAPKKIQLRTNFFDIPVQSTAYKKFSPFGMRYSGKNLAGNIEAANKLKEDHADFFNGKKGEELEKDLNGKGYHSETNYQFAARLIEYLKGKGGVVTFGCFSAKDRTGFLAERLMAKTVQPHSGGMSENEIFEKNILAEDNPNLNVCKENDNECYVGELFYIPGGLSLKMEIGIRMWKAKNLEK